jgi:hypothetical protein
MENEPKSMPGVEVLERTNEIRVPAGELGAVLELIVRNEKGEITNRQVMLSKSFVKQFLQALWMCSTFMWTTWPIQIKQTDGTLRSVRCDTSGWLANAPANNTNFGVLVGTGTTAPAIDDYAMETLIAHGTGPGQMQYSAVTFGAPTEDGSTSHFTVTRDFANNSGGSITVREIGLAVKLTDMATASRYFLILHDAVNIAVPDGETLTVNYRIQATV